jgi:hypothetical protein
MMRRTQLATEKAPNRQNGLDAVRRHLKGVRGIEHPAVFQERVDAASCLGPTSGTNQTSGGVDDCLFLLDFAKVWLCDGRPKLRYTTAPRVSCVIRGGRRKRI